MDTIISPILQTRELEAKVHPRVTPQEMEEGDNKNIGTFLF